MELKTKGSESRLINNIDQLQILQRVNFRRETDNKDCSGKLQNYRDRRDEILFKPWSNSL